MSDTDNSGVLEWLTGILRTSNYEDRVRELDAIDGSSPDPSELYSVPDPTHDRQGRTLDRNANPGIPHEVEFKPIEVDPELRRLQELIESNIKQQQLQNVVGNTPEEWVGQNLMAQNYAPNPEAINQAMAVASRDDPSLVKNSVRDGTAIAQNLRTHSEMQRAARMKAEADAFARMQGLLGSEETAPHRGLATLLGETLGFKDNTWSQDFRDALHLDEPVMQKILAAARGMGRKEPKFTDTLLSDIVGGFNLAEDRAIAGATAAQTAGLDAFKAETDRLTALKGEAPSGPELKLIQQTGTQIQVANRLAELQDFLYGSKGGVTGGGFRGIGHGIGTVARFLGAETGTSEEDVYQSLRANVNSLLIEAATYDERWNKNMVKDLVDKVLPKTGWTKSHAELEDAIATLLDTTQRRINNNQEILGHIGQGSVVGALHEAGRLGRSDFPGLVSIDGQPR